MVQRTGKIIIIVFAAVIIVLLGVLAFVNPAKGPTVPGGIVAQQPLTSTDGRLTVTAPLANDLIVSPVAVAGFVTGGGWFFEASFPVKILDGDGTVLWEGPMQAGGEPGGWMSTGTVPFSANITFKAPKYATGTMIFAKDNPSGLPENDLQLRVPVRFK